VAVPNFRVDKADKVFDIGVGDGGFLLTMYCFGFHCLGGVEMQEEAFQQFQVSPSPQTPTGCYDQ
jgi:hypothetical protein